MSINYNYFGGIEPSKIYLCKPNQGKICVLNGIDETTCSFTKNLQDYSEISFTVNKYIISDENKKVESNGYDSLHILMELYVDNVGRFVIDTEPTIENDGANETTTISARSLEKVFSYKDLVELEINTGSDTSIERLLTGNVNALGITQKYIQFYDSENADYSLLDILVSHINGWSVGHVDSDLATKKYSFTIDSQDIYSFMTQDMSNTFRCIIKFDTINKTVNAYSEENIGEDTNVFISFRNLANSVNIAPQSDNLYTRFTVKGSETLDVTQVNFGETKVEDLSYFMTNDYLSSTIINKYNTWQVYRDGRRNDYINTMKSYCENLEKRDEIISRVPCDPLNYDWNSFSLDELNKELDYFELLVDCIKTEFTDAQGNIDMEALEASVYWLDYKSYTTWIIPNIKTAIKNYDKVQAKKEDYDDSWETDWDLYGTDELSYKMELYQEQMKTLDAYKIVWSELTDEQKASYITENNYTPFHNQYVLANTNYNGANAKYTSLMVTVNNYNSALTQNQTTLSAIVTDVSIANVQFNFNSSELAIINSLYIDTDYTNENYLTSSLYTSSDKIDEEKLLLDDAFEELSKESRPQYSFSCEMDNLFALQEFKVWHTSVDVGNFIRMEVSENNQEKLRIVSLTYNPMMYGNNLSVKFSNMLIYRNNRNDFTELFNNAVSSSKNSISNTNVSGKDSAEVSTELIKYIMNSRYMSDKLVNTDTQNMTKTNASLKTALIDYAKVDNIQGLVATFVSETVDTAYVKTLISGHISTSDLTANTTSTNFITIGQDASGNKIQISANVLQFVDSNNNVFLQMGIDAQGNKSFLLTDENGTTLIDGTGIHADAIPDELIVDYMVKKKDNSYSGISADALNIDSVTTNVLDNENFVVNSTQVYFDDETQTLYEKFNTLSSTVETIENNTLYEVIIESSSGVLIDGTSTLTCKIYNTETSSIVSDTSSFTYQWYKDNVAIHNAINSTIVINSNNIKNYAIYSCKITY